MTPKKLEIAIVVRYNDDFELDGFLTVEEHNKIQSHWGTVWFGKYGVPINSSTLRLCTAKNVCAQLILVRRRRGNKEKLGRVHVAEISKAQTSQPGLKFIPDYYRKHASRYDTWFCLKSQLAPLSDNEASSWLMASSGQILSIGLKKCPRTFFLVVKSGHLALAKSFIKQSSAKIKITEAKFKVPEQ